MEGTADDTKLPSSCCDTIFLRHVYHHLTQPQEFDKNLVRSLKPGAHLAIIDFPPSSNLAPVEGVPKNRGGHGIPEKVVVEELTTAGLQVEKTHRRLVGERLLRAVREARSVSYWNGQSPMHRIQIVREDWRKEWSTSWNLWTDAEFTLAHLGGDSLH